MKYLLRMILFLVGVLAMLPAVPGRSQTTSPTTNRPLPPSILAELRRSQHTRTLTYRDTVFGSDIARAHFNDSTQREYSDSALAIVDTAVTLSHKEWLDSELVEIPELSRFGSHVHFNYPPSIMMETDIKAVPFDSTLLSQMNPVTRENLPFFDQSPIPMPLPAPRATEAFVEAGGGNVYQPFGEAWLEHAFSSRTSLDAFAAYRSLSRTPVHSLLNLSGTFDAQLGPDPAVALFHGSDLSLTLAYSRKTLAGIADSMARVLPIGHTLGNFHANVTWEGDVSDNFHYAARLSDREWGDDATSISESSQAVLVDLRYDPYISHFRLLGEAGYEHASPTGPQTVQFSPSIAAEHLNLLFGRRKGGAIEWYAGATFMAADEGTSRPNAVLPLARLRVPLNARWEVGASFEPQVRLSGWSTLTTMNPFLGTNFGQRSVVMDMINIEGFMNYALSNDDEFRLEARFITRKHEPVFRTLWLIDSATAFTNSASDDTRHIELTASGSFLLFTGDVFTASLTASHASFIDLPDSLPFEPTMNFAATYHFNSVSDVLFPLLELRSISRPGFTMNLFHAEVRWELSRPVSIVIRGENLLGSASDFWPGYPEYPRSVWASVKYRF